MNDRVHVLPTSDQVAHDESDDFPCGPTIEPVKRADGSCGWLVIHHSLDGRESQPVDWGSSEIQYDGNPWLQAIAMTCAAVAFVACVCLLIWLT